MEITTDNLPLVLGSPIDQLSTVLPALFEKILQPDQDEFFLRNYVAAIKQRFARDQRGPGQLGYDSFTKAAVAAGIVPTMMKITLSSRQEEGALIAASNAFEIFLQLSRFGFLEEKRALVEGLLGLNFVDVLLEKLANHPYHFHRQLATAVARAFLTENFLAEQLTPEKTAEIIVKLGQWCLSGTQQVVAEMQDPNKTWSSQMFMGAIGIPMRISAAYAPRHFALGQENTVMAISGIFTRVPPPPRKFVLEVLQHKPEIVDLLFQCAIEPRNPWYPETEVDAIACEVLATIFRLPFGRIPGVPVSLDDGEIKDEDDAEMNASLELLRILTSRPHWVSKVLAVWKKIEEEKWQKVKRLFDNVVRDYSAQRPPDAESFRAIFEYRGASRISMLRLISLVTLVPESLTDADIMLLLRPAYLSSQKVKSEDEVDWTNEEDIYNFIEHNHEVFRSPLWTITLPEDERKTIQSPCVIPGEAMLGPMALLRLLMLLSERGILDQIPSWTTIPPAMPSSLSLKQVKQMTDPEITKKLLALCSKRATREFERGHQRFRADQDVDHARAAYTASAELAATLVSFLESPQADTRSKTLLLAGSKKQLAQSLGHAAEMSNQFKQYEIGYKLAVAACTVGRAVKGEDMLRRKNKKRLNAAKQALGMPT